MALKITTQITTEEGFEVSNAFAYLNIYIQSPGSNWINLAYYKSEQDWVSGKQPLNVNQLPSSVQTELTQQEFWNNQLAMTLHEKCIAKIEEVVGEGNVEIIQ